MASSDYAGKSAYRGEVASRYEEDRRVEAVWRQEQEFVHEWVRSLATGKSLLDIPTGTGRFLEYFVQQNLKVHAQDISEDMLAEVRRAYPNASAQQIALRIGDAEHLSLADHSVDYVLSWRFLHLVPLPVVRAVLREFRRVCRGTIVVHVFAVDATKARPGLWAACKAALRPVWRRVRPAKTAGGGTPWSHIPSFSHPEPALLRAFADAGLTVQRIHTVEPDMEFPTRVYFLVGAEKTAGGVARP